MLRVALRPRFLGLLALMIAATVVCGLLASWQWDRAHRAMTEHRAAPEKAVPMQELIALGEPVTNEAGGRVVTVSGTFDPSEQVLVPGRSVDGTDAVIVVTAMSVPQEDGTQARLVVARGWMPASEVAGPAGRPDPSRIPAAPTGPVELTGHLEASEAATRGIQDGTVSELSTQLLVNEWGGPMYSGYLAETSPAGGLRPMPLAQSDFSRGLDWQNIGYALQWVIFGVFFLYLWWRSVRAAYDDEHHGGTDEPAADPTAAASEPSAGTGDESETTMTLTKEDSNGAD